MYLMIIETIVVVSKIRLLVLSYRNYKQIPIRETITELLPDMVYCHLMDMVKVLYWHCSKTIICPYTY
jgi:hypothetical protein